MITPNVYGTEDIQTQLLELMKVFHLFCEEKEIVYTLYGGSCLGAVRHKGFIPWDDDLDICLDRNNYNKLLGCFDECLGLHMHKTLWIDRIQKNGAEAIRDYVPTLDVFVIDHVPADPLRFKMKTFFLATLQGMLKEQVSYKGFSPVHKVLLFTTHMMGKLFSRACLHKWYERVSQIGNDEAAAEVHCTNTSYAWIKNKYPADTWASVLLSDFEDTRFYIPSAYDVYLKLCYGDYMRLPDEAHRKPEHIK